MNIENTCLLGNDFPFVSFFITDDFSKTSYGLGALIILRIAVKTLNEINGTNIPLKKN